MKEKTKNPGLDPYRPLTIPERDLLFALYDKHNGNRNAMIRDRDCQFKSYNQVTAYCKYYNFPTRFAETRRKRAEQTIAQLGDYKNDALQRAAEMVQPRQVLIQVKGPKGQMIPLKDVDGNCVYETVHPTEKELKVAWEIIKTELGEPTSVSKSDFGLGDTPVENVTVNIVHGTKPTGERGSREEPSEPSQDNS